nr:MAG TPA: hypothetical protein [Caudoviricetes sp.]
MRNCVHDIQPRESSPVKKRSVQAISAGGGDEACSRPFPQWRLEDIVFLMTDNRIYHLCYEGYPVEIRPPENALI